MLKEPGLKRALGLIAWGILAASLNSAGLLLRNHWLSGAGMVVVLVLTGLAATIVARWGRDRRREAALAEQLQVCTAELDRLAQRLAALNETALCLSRPLHLDEVLLQGAERIKRVLTVDAVHVRLIDEETRMLNLETAVGAPAEFLTEEAAVGVGECICGQVLSSAQPISVTNIGSDARVTRVACARHGYCAVAGVPLQVQDRLLGVLVVQNCRPTLAEPSDMELLGAIASQLSVAIENAQLYSEMEKRVQHLARRAEHMAIVQERERVSREIHDGLAQALALLNLRVGMAQSLLAAGQARQVRQELIEVAQVIDTANRDVREAIAALRMTSPKGAGFVPMLREFVLDFGMRCDLPTELRL